MEQPPTCADCDLFLDDPHELEQEFRHLLILSSAYGSTRGRCGICRVRKTFQEPEPACPEFRPRDRGVTEA